MARSNQEYNDARAMFPDKLAGARYLREETQLRGTQRPIVFKYGRYYDHPNYRELQEYLKVCQAEEHYV